VFDIQTKWQQKLHENPVQFLSNNLTGWMCYTTRNLAKFIGANSEDVFLIDNATTGVNTVLKSLKFSEKDNIIYTDLIYPGIEFSLHKLREFTSVNLKELKVSIPINFNKVLEDFENAIDSNTKLVVLDHITSKTAVILPVEQFIQIAKKKGVLVLIDGAHTVGQIPLNLSQLGADFYTSNCHKWLFSPLGSAFLWIKKEHQSKINPLVISNGYKDGIHAQFSWTGTKDYTALLAMNTAILFYQKVGGEKVMEHNNRLARKAADYLIQAWGTEGLADPSHHASIVTIKLPEWRADNASAPIAEKAEWLGEQLYHKYNIEVPIQIINGSLWIRISAQIYNYFEEYELLALAVQSLLLNK